MNVSALLGLSNSVEQKVVHLTCKTCLFYNISPVGPVSFAFPIERKHGVPSGPPPQVKKKTHKNIAPREKTESFDVQVALLGLKTWDEHVPFFLDDFGTTKHCHGSKGRRGSPTKA